MRKLIPLIVASGLLSASAVHAQLAHHYNLTDGTDSVASANGFVNSPGTINGNATFGGGMLTSPGTDNTSYLSLPSSVGTGVTGNFSIETYASTTNGGNSYSTLFSFASSQTNFILLNASRPNINTTTVDFQQSPSTPAEINVAANAPLLSDGLEHDLLFTYISATGVVTIYSDGAQVGTGNIGAGFNFQTAAAGAFDGINGHAPFTQDNTFAGTTDDFRIFSTALTASQVTAVHALGANATDAQITVAAGGVPEPSSWTAMLAGVGALLGLQRFRAKLV